MAIDPTSYNNTAPAIGVGDIAPPSEGGISYLGYMGDGIQADINEIDAIKLQIADEPKITSSTTTKQNTSGDYETAAQNAVNDAQSAINNVITMLSILCGSDDGIVDKKTEILTQKLTTPPRIHIKELSNRRGEYPTILRTGDVDRWGNFNVSFDDENVVFFNGINESTPIVFSNGLLVGDSKLNDKVSVDSLGPPVTYVTSDLSLINTPGNIVKGIGDETFDIYTPGEGISAFADSLNIVGTSDFYMTGTDENVYPGFISPLKSKTSFTIDITPTQEHVLARCPAEWITASLADSEALHQSTIPNILPHQVGPHTGFAYFTFCENIWEDVGIVDYSGLTPPHTHEIETNNSPHPSPTGLYHNPSQFIPANDLSAKYSLDIEEYSAAKFFASPTMAHDAPDHTKYFAKQAQEITLPISSPFLLEKISLSVPIAYFSTYDERNEESCIKTIDSLVFFLYHQRTNVGHEISTLLDTTAYRNVITGSIRTLIASGSAAFWQKTRSYITESEEVIGNAIELHHAPSFEYDWSAEFPLTGTYSSTATPVTFEKDLNLEIEMMPAVSQNAYKGQNMYPYVYTGGASPLFQNTNLRHKWMQGERDPTPDEITYPTGLAPSDTNLDMPMKAKFPNRFVKSKTGTAKSNTVEFDADGQTIEMPKTSSPTSVISPYVLLPGDSLILGVEYLPCAPSADHAGSTDLLDPARQFHLSSSYVTIKAAQASMTMYGSLIKENKEYHETRNQDLTSLSIHEAMHSNPVLDQFEIEPSLMYSGSMLNEYVSGSILDDGTGSSAPRSVKNNVSLDSAVAEWSLLRGVRTIDEKERFYDTLLPDITTSLSDAGLVKVSSTAGATATSVTDGFGTTSDISTGTIRTELDTILVNSYHETEIDISNLYVHPDSTSVTHENLFHEISSAPGTYWSSATYNYHVEFMTGSSVAAPFSTEYTKRSDMEGVSILTRYATQFHDNDVPDIWYYTYTPPFGTPQTALKFGPVYEVIQAASIRSALYRNGLTSLDSDSYENTHYLFGNPVYTFGFDSGIVSNNTSFSYGVRNTIPINTSAVYRHQHYGYFRDMLEQRQFSRFYKKSTSLTEQSAFKYGMQTAQSYITQGPLTVKFVEPNTETIADPIDTWTSSNLDNHATSSLPFIEGDPLREYTNRTYAEISVP
jgi:hypothetical protein